MIHVSRDTTPPHPLNPILLKYPREEMKRHFLLTCPHKLYNMWIYFRAQGIQMFNQNIFHPTESLWLHIFVMVFIKHDSCLKSQSEIYSVLQLSSLKIPACVLHFYSPGGINIVISSCCSGGDSSRRETYHGPRCLKAFRTIRYTWINKNSN